MIEAEVVDESSSSSRNDLDQLGLVLRIVPDTSGYFRLSGKLDGETIYDVMAPASMVTFHVWRLLERVLETFARRYSAAFLQAALRKR